jgi:predicted nuclease of restriction endonuclease-like (RecB) superfamily
LVTFIKGFDESFNLSPNSITKLKTRGLAPKNVARIPIVLEFVDYVKKTFPDFDSEKFLSHDQ